MKIRNIIISLVIAAVILAFSGCKEKGPDPNKLDKGWQNSEKETFADEETTEKKHESETKPEKDADIKFSESRATILGTLNSEIYGPLKIYLQDGYFLILDEYGEKKFNIFAEYYNPEKVEKGIIFYAEDMNFDNYTDFRVCFQNDSLNTYFYCFLWDMSAKSFTYHLELSSVASPVFNGENRTVVSEERESYTMMNKRTFTWQNGRLKLISNESVEIEETTAAAESVDVNYSYSDNSEIAEITLDVNKGSSIGWLCKIENENYVVITDHIQNIDEGTETFRFRGVSPGITTVIFRYASSWDAEFVDEFAINISSDENGFVAFTFPDIEEGTT